MPIPSAADGPAFSGSTVSLTILMMRYVHIILGLVCAVSTGCSSAPVTPSTRTLSGSDAVFARAFEQHTRNLQVEGQGVVRQVLSDDNDGSRHQRFILELGSGQTLLIAHNIDLAPRVAGLREGDTVSFGGVYEWNPEGGVIHWTHRDTSKRHLPGWLKHNGELYQ